MKDRSNANLPPKPYPAFPLFAHRGGSWKKKIDGQQKAFGAWRWPDDREYTRSWKTALKAYHDWVEARARGLELVDAPERSSVETLVDTYLTVQESRVGKEIEPRTFAERRKVLVEFKNAIGPDTTIARLEADPDLLVDHLKDLEGRYGFHRYNTHVKEIAGAFIAAEHPLTGVLGRPFRLRPLLKRKKDIVRRREKRVRETAHGKQRWLPDEIRAFFDHAEQPLLAMIGLGYFAGFGNSDCADVPQHAFAFKPHRNLGVPDGWAILNWVRPKTEIDRAAVLPAFVADQVKAAIKARPNPAAKKLDHLTFLTSPHPFLTSVKGGLPYVRDIVHLDDGQSITKTVRVDGVMKGFNKLRDRLSQCPAHGWVCKPIERRGRGFRSDKKKMTKRGNDVTAHLTCPLDGCGKDCRPMRKLGFYTFRHTATTYAIPAASMEVRVLFEGHLIEGVRAHYVEELDTGELVKIAVRLQEKMEEVTHNDESPSDASGS